MATPTFKSLIEKELQGKIRKNSQEALLLSAVKSKKSLLEGTIELRGSEAFDEETLASLDYAADELAEQIIDSILEEEKPTYSRRSKIKVGAVAGLRTQGGQFISALKLRTLLNVTLQKYIKDRMGTEGRLNYVTGRLAASADVTSLEEATGDGMVSLYFTYMTYPYATFERGGKQYRPGREPSELIDLAINDALADILNTSSLKRIDTVFGGSI